MKFQGYKRKNGSIGVRNHVLILPTVGCTNEVALKISERVNGAIPILHHQGCGQLSFDLETAERVLKGLGKNPNVNGLLIVSMGCESMEAEKIKKEVEPDKPVEIVRLMELHGITDTISKGTEIAQEMVTNLNRKEISIDNLTIGIKCGASDTTSGIASNPAVGAAVDRFIEEGATVIFGETTETIGAEHELVHRASSEEVEEKIMNKTNEMEERTKAYDVDIRGANPSEGNIKGGLTTIEEKSLGAIEKGGSKEIQDVLEYGETPPDSGLYFMDSPGREMEFLPGVAAAGCQIILFSTGLGAPQGFPILPVVKISGNQETCKKLEEHIDVDVTAVIRGTESIEEAGDKVFKKTINVASGEKVKAEKLGFEDHGVNTNIYATGPVL